MAKINLALLVLSTSIICMPAGITPNLTGFGNEVRSNIPSICGALGFGMKVKLLGVTVRVPRL